MSEVGKICACCKKLKPISYYHNYANSIDGKNASCKECVRARVNLGNIKNGRKLDEEYIFQRMLLTRLKAKFYYFNNKKL